MEGCRYNRLSMLPAAPIKSVAVLIEIVTTPGTKMEGGCTSSKVYYIAAIGASKKEI